MPRGPACPLSAAIRAHTDLLRRVVFARLRGHEEVDPDEALQEGRLALWRCLVVTPAPADFRTYAASAIGRRVSRFITSRRHLERLPDTLYAPDAAAKIEARDGWRAVTRWLTEEEARVLWCHYGEGKTLREVAAECRTTLNRAWRVERRALAKAKEKAHEVLGVRGCKDESN